MPIRRIITIVREQIDSIQKRFSSNDKKSATVEEAPVAGTAAKEGEEAAVEAEVPVEVKATA